VIRQASPLAQAALQIRKVEPAFRACH
jgi:hypothetical protein